MTLPKSLEVTLLKYVGRITRGQDWSLLGQF